MQPITGKPFFPIDFKDMTTFYQHIQDNADITFRGNYILVSAPLAAIRTAMNRYQGVTDIDSVMVYLDATFADATKSVGKEHISATKLQLSNAMREFEQEHHLEHQMVKAQFSEEAAHLDQDIRAVVDPADYEVAYEMLTSPFIEAKMTESEANTLIADVPNFGIIRDGQIKVYDDLEAIDEAYPFLVEQYASEQGYPEPTNSLQRMIALQAVANKDPRLHVLPTGRIAVLEQRGD